MSDEEILAAIVQAALTDKRIQILANNPWGFVGAQKHGVYPCCAIAAGAIYAGLHPEDPGLVINEFARRYRVTEQYACGVSDGFEAAIGITSDCDKDHPDYIRGWAVGSAVATAVLP